MKPDERALLIAIAGTPGGERVTLRDAGEALGIHPKRVAYLAEKWCDRGWYDYGVSADLGWLTPDGLLLIDQLRSKT